MPSYNLKEQALVANSMSLDGSAENIEASNAPPTNTTDPASGDADDFISSSSDPAPFTLRKPTVDAVDISRLRAAYEFDFGVTLDLGAPTWPEDSFMAGDAEQLSFPTIHQEQQEGEQEHEKQGNFQVPSPIIDSEPGRLSGSGTDCDDDSPASSVAHLPLNGCVTATTNESSSSSFSINLNNAARETNDRILYQPVDQAIHEDTLAESALPLDGVLSTSSNSSSFYSLSSEANEIKTRVAPQELVNQAAHDATLAVDALENFDFTICGVDVFQFGAEEYVKGVNAAFDAFLASSLEDVGGDDDDNNAEIHAAATTAAIEMDCNADGVAYEGVAELATPRSVTTREHDTSPSSLHDNEIVSAAIQAADKCTKLINDMMHKRLVMTDPEIMARTATFIPSRQAERSAQLASIGRVVDEQLLHKEMVFTEAININQSLCRLWRMAGYISPATGIRDPHGEEWKAFETLCLDIDMMRATRQEKLAAIGEEDGMMKLPGYRCFAERHAASITSSGDGDTAMTGVEAGSAGDTQHVEDAQSAQLVSQTNHEATSPPPPPPPPTQDMETLLPSTVVDDSTNPATGLDTDSQRLSASASHQSHHPPTPPPSAMSTSASTLTPPPSIGRTMMPPLGLSSFHGNSTPGSITAAEPILPQLIAPAVDEHHQEQSIDLPNSDFESLTGMSMIQHVERIENNVNGETLKNAFDPSTMIDYHQDMDFTYDFEQGQIMGVDEQSNLFQENFVASCKAGSSADFNSHLGPGSKNLELSSGAGIGGRIQSNHIGMPLTEPSMLFQPLANISPYSVHADRILEALDDQNLYGPTACALDTAAANSTSQEFSIKLSDSDNDISFSPFDQQYSFLTDASLMYNDNTTSDDISALAEGVCNGDTTMPQTFLDSSGTQQCPCLSSNTTACPESCTTTEVEFLKSNATGGSIHSNGVVDRAPRTAKEVAGPLDLTAAPISSSPYKQLLPKLPNSNASMLQQHVEQESQAPQAITKPKNASPTRSRTESTPAAHGKGDATSEQGETQFARLQALQSLQDSGVTTAASTTPQAQPLLAAATKNTKAERSKRNAVEKASKTVKTIKQKSRDSTSVHLSEEDVDGAAQEIANKTRTVTDSGSHKDTLAYLAKIYGKVPAIWGYTPWGWPVAAFAQNREGPYDIHDPKHKQFHDDFMDRWKLKQQSYRKEQQELHDPELCDPER
ncbi:hypothetical protein BD289DRAFT_451736 [Coniella lustricola]|uniref:Uncharacterized protein n=1 Tax=Coniella lustricola TaxID=2025994 RepID=A0A2T3ADW8_9PEZI|nr:hypothetical protein BD289DRAFT_451736 [Coniella lustricola]